MDNNTQSCIALWCAVLERAILDELDCDFPNSEKPLRTKDFFNKGEMFPLICDLIGLDVGWARRERERCRIKDAKRRTGNPPGRPRKNPPSGESLKPGE